MKKLKLCRYCEITSECMTNCQDAVDAEKQDNSDLYMKKKYKAQGMANSWDQQKAILNNEEFK